MLEQQLHVVGSLYLSSLQERICEEKNVEDGEEGGQQLYIFSVILPAEKDKDGKHNHAKAMQLEAKSEVKVAAIEQLIVRLYVVPAE